MIWQLLIALNDPASYAVRFDHKRGEFYIERLESLIAQGVRVKDPSRFESKRP